MSGTNIVGESGQVNEEYYENTDVNELTNDDNEVNESSTANTLTNQSHEKSYLIVWLTVLLITLVIPTSIYLLIKKEKD